MPPPAIAALAGIEHVGLLVPDVDAAARFFADVTGAQTLYDVGPFDEAQDWMAHHLAPNGAQIHRMRVIQVANGPTLELIECVPRETPGAGVYGGFHVAFYVEDMEAAVAALKEHGVKIMSGPVEMTEGPSAGLTWLYFRAPWGQQLELVSYPGGIAGYRGRAAQVWRPR